jgi:hypothetical protein
MGLKPEYTNISIPVSIHLRDENGNRVTGKVFHTILGKIFAEIWNRLESNEKNDILAQYSIDINILNEVFDHAFNPN